MENLTAVCADLNDLFLRILPEDWQSLDADDKIRVVHSVLTEESLRQYALDIRGRIGHSIVSSLDDYFTLFLPTL
jgi:hypothetical protein